MPRDHRKYLHDMLDSTRFLRGLSTGKSEGDLHADRTFRSAVERELQIVGEALIALNKVQPEIAATIPEYKRIIRFRHVLVHGYDQVDQGVVWNVLESKLPDLIKTLEDLLSNATDTDWDPPL